jgi:hypothetical protein
VNISGEDASSLLVLVIDADDGEHEFDFEPPNLVFDLFINLCKFENEFLTKFFNLFDSSHGVS